MLTLPPFQSQLPHPAIGLVYLVAAPTSIGKRLLHLAGALATFLVSAGWFVVLTLVWPASSRPYIAGSTDNNFMNLVLGYNGFARVLGKNNGNFAPNPVVGASAGTQVRGLPRRPPRRLRWLR